MLNPIRRHPWLTVLAGVLLPGILSAVIEYFWTPGVPGLPSIYSAIAGGGLSGIVVLFLLKITVQETQETAVGDNKIAVRGRVVPGETSLSNTGSFPTANSGSEGSPSSNELIASTGDKLFCQRTPAELVAEMKGKTSIVAANLLERHKGQWIRANGSIRDVSKDTSREGHQVILNWTDSQPAMGLYFDSGTYGGYLGSCNVGDSIDAIGKIGNIYENMVFLTECELV